MIHGDGPTITMAQACGEHDYAPLAYVAAHARPRRDRPGRSRIRMATEADALSRADRLADENAALRRELAALYARLDD